MKKRSDDSLLLLLQGYTIIEPSGRSAVWLARPDGVGEVGGKNSYSRGKVN
jgi:hypothetical protein